MSSKINSTYLDALVKERKKAYLRGNALQAALQKYGVPWVHVLRVSDDYSTAVVQIQNVNASEKASDDITVSTADIVGVVIEKKLVPSRPFAKYLTSRIGKRVALIGDALRIAAHYDAVKFATLVELQIEEQFAIIKLLGTDVRVKDDVVMVTTDTILDLSKLSKVRIVRSDSASADGAITIHEIEKRVCKLACEAMQSMARTGVASEYTGKSAIESGFCKACAPSGALPSDTQWRSAVSDALAIVTRVKGDKNVRFIRFSCPSEIAQESNPFQLSDTQCHAFLLLVISDKGTNKYYITSAGLPLFVKGAIVQLAMPGSDAWANSAVYASVEWGDMPGWASALEYFTNLHFVCKRLDDAAVRNLLKAAFSRGYEQSTGDLRIEPTGMRTGGAACAPADQMQETL